MVQKRPFDAEEILEVPIKHPKQVGPSNQLVSFSESVFPEDVCHIPKTSEAFEWYCLPTSDSAYQEMGECRRRSNEVELPRGAVDFETSFPGGIPVSSWGTTGTSEEDIRSEPPVHLPFVPECVSPERPIRTLVRYEDIYSILLEHPPHKLVSVGANHQADVPVWDSAATVRPNASDAVGDEVEERLMGTCIIPMPRMELSSIYDNEEVGKGRTDCSCEDRGSVRCVRQHIVEAREELMKTIGHEIFTDLGLSDMGEQVADKWSAEEERLFREVVFNNPATLDKNFWNYLSIGFISKTKKEIVSYYFNVFMLRRRAEQNRNDLLNIDSDDDEWQGSDGNAIATREEDEDSVTESLVYQDDACLANCHENDLQVNDEYASDETFAVIQPQDQPVWRERFDEEVQDDSCTSSDAGVASQETQVKIENGDHWCGNYNGVCNGYSQGYVLEP